MGFPCSNCARRRLLCSYSAAPGARPEANVASASEERPFQSSSTVDVPFGLSSSTKLLELKFLHQYTITTHKALTDIFETPDLWPVLVVRDAFNHDFLLNGIFFLVALQEAHGSADSKSALSIKSSEYLEAALKKFRVLLASITVENENAMFAFSCIICVCTFVHLLPSPETPQTWSVLIDRLGAFLKCLQGARNIVIASDLWNKPGPFFTYLVSLQITDEIAPVETDVQDALARLKSLQAENADHNAYDRSEAQLYNTAIDCLKACWQRKILAIEWFNDRGKAFQTKLRKQDPMAKLILAYWGASVQDFEHFWWGTGIGKNIVDCVTRDLETSFTGASLDFFEAISWPRRRVGLEDGGFCVFVP